MDWATGSNTISQTITRYKIEGTNISCLIHFELQALWMKPFLILFRFGAVLWFVLSATVGRATLAFITSETIFDASTNDLVS